MVILIDMDDVIEQLLKGWLKYLNEHYGTNVTVADVTEWDLSKVFPQLTHEQLFAPNYVDEFWDLVEPLPGADEAMRKLLADGHEIYIVTTAFYKTIPAKMERVLFKYFPYLDWDHVIITSNKHLINGDILIDDGPHNLSGGNYKKILFTANHNHDFDEKSVGAVRVNNWEEAYREVQRIAAEK